MATRYASFTDIAGDRTVRTDIAHAYITGGGGVRLHVIDTGNRAARPIVFIHGFSQSWMSWQRQMDSDLADEFQLVAMDLRGHGTSDKPRDAYSDRLQWADDINAVIRELNLEQPLLCGWSYGSLVILDYIRQYGEAGIGGVAVIDGLTKLGTEAALSVLTPELLRLVPGLWATNAEECIRSLSSLLRLCFAQEPSAEDMYRMLGYNVSVPPHVRQALFSRSLDNDDLLPTLRKPALIVHGAEDAVVKPSIVDQHAASMRHAQVCVMQNTGHSPFWDDAASFNEVLRSFTRTL
jgi:pimeloyl-ACP methyl ester carboxylesterase